MSYQLKIKFLSLAAEARVIKAQEKRTLAQMRKRRAKQKPVGKLEFQWSSMRDHRRFEVRVEARATHLARAFLKGMPYRKVEKEGSSHVRTRRIAAMVRKYGKVKMTEDQSIEAVNDWLEVEG